MRILVICLILCMVALVFTFREPALAEDSSSSVVEDVKAGFVDPSLLEIITVEFAADPYSRSNYDPFVKVRVFNNSTEVVTRAFINVVFTADQGNHKLFSEKFVQIVDGGMRPYTSAVWKFYPRGSSAMALKGLPRDTTIAASVYKVFCPKKNSPWQYEHKFNYPKRHDFAW